MSITTIKLLWRSKTPWDSLHGILSTREYDYLNGAWDDRIIGPVSTEQRDSVPRKANIRMQDLRHNDYTTWRFPKD